MSTTIRSVFRALAALALLAAADGAWAGKYNTVVDIGDRGPAWEDLIGVDGEQHSLSDLEDAEAVVVVFTCNSCPYAVDAEDRLVALRKKYSRQDVAVIAINVNLIEEDQLPAMKRRAEEKKFTFPYLFDPSQEIARRYGAKFTPQFFVLDRQRRVVYMGALNDSPDGTEVTERYVEAAVDAVLNRKQVSLEETVPIGCLIRFERNRRGR